MASTVKGDSADKENSQQEVGEQSGEVHNLGKGNILPKRTQNTQSKRKSALNIKAPIKLDMKVINNFPVEKMTSKVPECDPDLAGPLDSFPDAEVAEHPGNPKGD